MDAIVEIKKSNYKGKLVYSSESLENHDHKPGNGNRWDTLTTWKINLKAAPLSCRRGYGDLIIQLHVNNITSIRRDALLSNIFQHFSPFPSLPKIRIVSLREKKYIYIYITISGRLSRKFNSKNSLSLGNFNNIPSERRETTPYRNAQRENGARKVHVRKEFHCLCSRMEVERLGRQGEITRRSVGGTRRGSCQEIKKTEIIHQAHRERERERETDSPWNVVPIQLESYLNAPRIYQKSNCSSVERLNPCALYRARRGSRLHHFARSPPRFRNTVGGRSTFPLCRDNRRWKFPFSASSVVFAKRSWGNRRRIRR